MPLTAKDILAASPKERLRLLRENMETLSSDDLNEIISSVTDAVTQKLAAGLPAGESRPQIPAPSDAPSNILAAEPVAVPSLEGAPDVICAGPTPEPSEPAPLVLTERVSNGQSPETVRADAIDEDEYETAVLILPGAEDEQASPEVAHDETAKADPTEREVEAVTPSKTDTGLTFDSGEFDEAEEAPNEEGASAVEDQSVHVAAPVTTTVGHRLPRPGAVREVARQVVQRFDELVDSDEQGGKKRLSREKIFGLLPIPTAIAAAYFGTVPISAAISAPPRFEIIVAIVILLMVSWLVCEATRIDAQKTTSLSVKLAAAISCYYPIEAWSHAMAGQPVTTSDLIYLIVPATLGLSVLWSSVKGREK